MARGETLMIAGRIGAVALTLGVAGCTNGGGGGGGASAPIPAPLQPPAWCLGDEIPCVVDDDCATLPGTRCNVAAREPMCQTIRCNVDGGACSDDALCPTGTTCLEGRCGTCDAPLPPRTACVSGELRCEVAGETACDDGCFDLQSDEEHCGNCYNDVSGRGGSCVDGALSCGSETACNGWCTDLETDDYNCGECGTTCPFYADHACPDEVICIPGYSCRQGRCSVIVIHADRWTPSPTCPEQCALIGAECVEATFSNGVGSRPCTTTAPAECVCAYP